MSLLKEQQARFVGARFREQLVACGLKAEMDANPKIPAGWELTDEEILRVFGSVPLELPASIEAMFRAQIEKLGRLMGLAATDVPRLGEWAVDQQRQLLDAAMRQTHAGRPAEGSEQR